MVGGLGGKIEVEEMCITKGYHFVKWIEEAEAFVSALKNGKGMPIPFEQLYATTKATLLEEEAILTGNKLEIKHG